MTNLFYYALLSLLLILGIGAYLFKADTEAMAMTQMVTVSVLLAIYVIVMSLAGETGKGDERADSHKYLSNRIALLVGTIVLSLGIIIQLFNHNLDYWLVVALGAINVTKIATLLWAKRYR